MIDYIRNEEQKKILQERALLLARKKTGRLEKDETLEIVEFSLDKERYAIPSTFVQEILLAKSLQAIPNTPPFVVGIMSVRGEIVAINDLRVFFKKKKREFSRDMKVLFLSSETMRLGILAHKIIGTKTLFRKEILSKASLTHPYEEGLVFDDVVLLSGAKILNDESLIVHERLND